MMGTCWEPKHCVHILKITVMQAQIIIVILQHNTATLQLFSEPVYSEVSAYSHHLIAINFRTIVQKCTVQFSAQILYIQWKWDWKMWLKCIKASVLSLNFKIQPYSRCIEVLAGCSHCNYRNLCLKLRLGWHVSIWLGQSYRSVRGLNPQPTGHTNPRPPNHQACAQPCS